MMRDIGDFELQEEVGRGGMGVVYRAQQKSLGREVAVKLLPSELAAQPNVAERFGAEAQRMARLAHPNIAQVYVVGEEGGVRFFAMEYLSGRSLQERLYSGPLPIDHAVSIGYYVAQALDYAHRSGIVHRDIKPANIMFDGTGRVVVTDFGIAKAADEVRLTATGTTLGTPEYMAPEQARGNPIDGRADLYALGIVLYEMVCGRPPFTADTPIGTVMKHLNESPAWPRTFCPNVPEWLEAIILKALAKEPADRFASASEMAEALRGAGLTQPIPLPSPVAAQPVASPTAYAGAAVPPTVVMPPPRSTSPAPWIIAAVVLFALIGIGALVGAVFVDSQRGQRHGGPPSQPPEEMQMMEAMQPPGATAPAGSGPVGGYSPPPAQMPSAGGAPAEEPTPSPMESPPSGPTPAEASPSGSSSGSSEEADKEELQRRYDGWLDAWRRKDIDSYMSYYSTSAVKETSDGQNRSYSQIRSKMQEVWSNCGSISLESGDPQISEYTGSKARMTAYQSYDSATYADQGTKILVWYRGDDGWVIIRESFNATSARTKP